MPEMSNLSLVLLLVIVGVNVLLNIAANASFRVSATSQTWQSFLTWQVAGNLAGLGTVLTLTALLRFLPLHVAFTITTGLAVVGVQVVAAVLLFHEAITPVQWLGTLLVVAGIGLIGVR